MSKKPLIWQDIMIESENNKARQAAYEKIVKSKDYEKKYSKEDRDMLEDVLARLKAFDENMNKLKLSELKLSNN